MLNLQQLKNLLNNKLNKYKDKDKNKLLLDLDKKLKRNKYEDKTSIFFQKIDKFPHLKLKLLKQLEENIERPKVDSLRTLEELEKKYQLFFKIIKENNCTYSLDIDNYLVVNSSIEHGCSIRFKGEYNIDIDMPSFLVINAFILIEPTFHNPKKIINFNFLIFPDNFILNGGIYYDDDDNNKIPKLAIKLGKNTRLNGQINNYNTYRLNFILSENTRIRVMKRNLFWNCVEIPDNVQILPLFDHDMLVYHFPSLKKIGNNVLIKKERLLIGSQNVLEEIGNNVRIEEISDRTTSLIKKIGKNVYIGGPINLTDTVIKNFPSDFKNNGIICIGNSNIENIDVIKKLYKPKNIFLEYYSHNYPTYNKNIGITNVRESLQKILSRLKYEYEPDNSEALIKNLLRYNTDKNKLYQKLQSNQLDLITKKEINKLSALEKCILFEYSSKDIFEVLLKNGYKFTQEELNTIKTSKAKNFYEMYLLKIDLKNSKPPIELNNKSTNKVKINKNIL